jgi:hypothetical protein
MSRHQELGADQYIASTLTGNNTLMGQPPEPEEDKARTVGTCYQVQGDPTGVRVDVNRVLARGGKSYVNLAS